MNAKQYFVAVFIAAAGASAFATEATQFADTPSTASRESVRAELRNAQRSDVGRTETYGSVEPPITSARTRAEVHAEAHAAAKARTFNPLYVGA